MEDNIICMLQLQLYVPVGPTENPDLSCKLVPVSADMNSIVDRVLNSHTAQV